MENKEEFYNKNIDEILSKFNSNVNALNNNKTLKQHWNDFKTNMYNWSQEDKKSLLTTLDLIIYLNRKEVKDE